MWWQPCSCSVPAYGACAGLTGASVNNPPGRGRFTRVACPVALLWCDAASGISPTVTIAGLLPHGMTGPSQIGDGRAIGEAWSVTGGIGPAFQRTSKNDSE